MFRRPVDAIGQWPGLISGIDIGGGQQVRSVLATPRSDAKPVFAGPYAAFEKFDHLLSSPTSVGSDRFNDLRDLSFGEREAIKLALTQVEASSIVGAESDAPHQSLGQCSEGKR